ncbi:MAG: nucleotide exchange factor GrpE [Candidatus Omnitrophica bacterium]|nr:nucleotide exchange factor GrpE [Candidatus Omnitrophota bacterium]
MNKETQSKSKEAAEGGNPACPPTQDRQAKISPGKAVTIPEAEYQKLIQDAVNYKDQYVRLYAEFENARKRMERERQEFVKYANEGLIAEFLNILDNLERSVEAAQAKHEDYEAFLKGVEMIMAQIHEMLKKNGVKPIEAKGLMFDPHHHEVLMQEETDGHEEGTVIEELQKGYTLGERVIRTSKVKVAKNKGKS